MELFGKKIKEVQDNGSVASCEKCIFCNICDTSILTFPCTTSNGDINRHFEFEEE